MRSNQVTQRTRTAPAARTGRHLLAALLLVALSLALTAAPAFAAEAHPSITTIDGLNYNTGVAVDESSGNLFIADGQPSESIKIYGPKGEAPVGGVVTTEIKGFDFGYQQVTLAIDDSLTSPSRGALYVANVEAQRIDKYIRNGANEYVYNCQINGRGSGCTAAGGTADPFIANGPPPGPGQPVNGKPFQLTVDSKGNLFVTDENTTAIYEFGPEGEDLATIPVELEGEARIPKSIAVNSTGDLFVTLSSGSNGEGIYRYAANATGQIEPGTEPTKFLTGGQFNSTATIAIDPSTDDLYLDLQSHVAVYGPSGVFKGEIGKEILGGVISGIAVNSQSGYVYVSNRSLNQVAIFGPAVLVPDATTEKATAVERTTATLHGTVSAAGGPSTTCLFQYADDAAFKANRFKGAPSVPCDPAGPFTGTGISEVEAKASGLTAGTTYHFRLLASNENGANEEVNEPTLKTFAAVNLETGKASGLSATAATLNGTIDPEGTEPENCDFEYLTEAAYQANLKVDHDGFTGSATAPCAETPAEIGAGNGAVPVHTDLSGLTSETLYRFRLAASNAFGTTKGADFLFGPPRIDASAVSQITSGGTVVEGLVNPDGVATTYVVQYVSEADFAEGEWAKATGIPLGGETVGSGIEAVSVAQQIPGLTPLTTYHFRILAENASGKAGGAAKTFTTYGSEGAGLPDARVYEQVTPVDKNGAAPGGDISLIQAARDGSAITFLSRGGIPGSEGAQKYPNYLASRGSDWSTRGLLPPAALGSTAGVLGLSQDLTRAYVAQSSLPASPADLSQRDNATGGWRPIALKGENVETFRYVGGSTGGSTVVFESGTKLPPGGVEEAPNIYAWDRGSGMLSLAGVFNNGLPPEKGALAGSNEPSNLRHFLQAQHTVSSDGSRVFFSDIANGQLYLRQNPTQPQSALGGKGNCTEAALACTLQVSASKRSTPDPLGPKPAAFWGATPDGSVAFFTSPAKLTNNATTGPKDEGNDLYRYEAGSGSLTDLTPDKAATDPNGAEVRGVLGASEDGSYVYFAANGVLSKTLNAQGEKATLGNCSVTGPVQSGSGTCNLYLAHEGKVAFIAKLQVTSLGSRYDLADSANWLFSYAKEGDETSSRVSADGQSLLFRSQLSLTGYDSQGFPELYRYSASDNALRCISCNPTGAAPVGAAMLRSIRAQGEFGTSPIASTLTQNLSADGNRVFFETPDKLIAGDTNGEGGCPVVYGTVARTCQDIYEWEAAGSGTCSSARQNGGCLYLLSTGTSPEASFFADASASGNDAFFFSAQPLVGQDKDQILDIYDARVGGGIASQNPTPLPICPTPEACRGGVPASPANQSPGTSSFAGPGNPKPFHHKKKKKKKSHHKKRQHKRPATRQHG
jgi:hypothetical protein